MVNRSGSSKPINAFRNDGSFLEMFKKLQAQQQQQQQQAEEGPGDEGSCSPGTSDEKKTTSTSTSSAKPSVPLVGKRRGGRILPTGKVKKPKSLDDEEETPKDAWAQYLAEVKRYRETTCETDEKTRPLVK